MREIDDTHDAEDEIEAESDEAEVQPIEQSREDGVEEHPVKHGRASPPEPSTPSS